MGLDPRPFVSVIVPVLNGEGTIGDCVASLRAQDYPPDRREILVVDNGSDDATVEIVRRHGLSPITEPRRGAARARNHAIASSRGEILAFTDADCLATTGWLGALVDRFADASVGGVAGEVLPYPPRTAAERYAAHIRHLSPRRYLGRAIFPFAVTANLAFRRGVFKRIGLFDPDSPRGGESTDFCTRFFRQTDLQLVFEPRASVLHRHRATSAEFFRQQWSYGRGHAFLYTKYRDEIPWGWRQTARVYSDLVGSAATLIAVGAAGIWDSRRREELHLRWFEFLRKLALRLGFATEALSRGRLLL